MDKMKKKDLVQAIVAKNEGMTAKTAEAAVDSLIEVITEQLQAGNAVPLPGLGTFAIKTRNERQARNPRKPGEFITVPRQNIPTFKASAALKRAIIGE